MRPAAIPGLGVQAPLHAGPSEGVLSPDEKLLFSIERKVLDGAPLLSWPPAGAPWRSGQCAHAAHPLTTVLLHVCQAPLGMSRAMAMGGSFCDHTEPGWVLLPGLSQGPGLPLTGERRCSFLLLSGPWRLSMTLGGRAASSQAPAGGRPVARGPAVMGRCAQAPMPSSPGLSWPDCLVPEVNPLCCGWTVTA